MFDFLDKTGLKAVLEQIKAKFPSSLPANGGNADYATTAGNADKLDGKHASDFADNIYKGYPGGGNCNNATTQGVYSVSHSSQNAPDANYYILTVDVAGDGTWMVQTAISVTFESKVYRRMYINGVWGAWYNVTPIKSTTFSATADGTGNFNLWAPDENKVPISIQLDNKTFYAVPFLYNNQLWLGSTINEVTRQPVADTSVSGTIYYIEV